MGIVFFFMTLLTLPILIEGVNCLASGLRVIVKMAVYYPHTFKGTSMSVLPPHHTM